jgi:hypothetical protein
MKDKIIKVGFCAAYDWELLKESVPIVYPEADIICLSLDKKRLSWSGKPFPFNDEAFFSWVKQIDKDNKIQVYEDDFYSPGVNALENDSRQRTLMADFMGPGGWHLQIDADEYFFDFAGFKKYLLNIHAHPDGTEKPINVFVNAIPLIKRTEKGFLYVNNKHNTYEEMPCATNKPEYQAARKNSHFNHLSPFFILHETWARGEEELWRKINSWGHVDDFESKDSYFNLWRAFDENNYVYIKDFNYYQAETWQSLGYLPFLNIAEAIEWLKKHGNIKVTNKYLFKRNSRLFMGLKQRLNF